MRSLPFLLIMSFALATAFGCQKSEATDGADEVIAMERRALDRWGRGDPSGFLEIMAPEMTYFDPYRSDRVDGLAELERVFGTIRGKIKVDRFDMIEPRVQRHGDVALLTFNLVSYGRQATGAEKILSRWNSTEVYARTEQGWRIVHSHWSFVQPALKEPTAEGA